VRNAPAFWSLVVGVLAVAAVPATVAYAYWSERLDLIWGGAAVPAALLLGVGALVLARRGERLAGLTLVRRTGSAAARAGRLLGIAALLVAGAGVTALAVYVGLTHRGGS
jgi:hypothetical protein